MEKYQTNIHLTNAFGFRYLSCRKRENYFMTESLLPKIKELEKIYGTANSNAFGSAVFYEAIPEDKTVEEMARKHYRDFIGDKWTTETENTWLSGWKNVYIRQPGKEPDILNELDELTDPQAKLSVPLLTEIITNAEQGRKFLAAVFDHPLVEKLTVNLVGDGDELSGIIVTGDFSDKNVCSVIGLLD